MAEHHKVIARARLAVSAAGWWLRQWYHAALAAHGPDKPLGSHCPEDTVRNRHRYAWGVCSGLARLRWRAAVRSVVLVLLLAGCASAATVPATVDTMWADARPADLTRRGTTVRFHGEAWVVRVERVPSAGAYLLTVEYGGLSLSTLARPGQPVSLLGLVVEVLP